MDQAQSVQLPAVHPVSFWRIQCGALARAVARDRAGLGRAGILLFPPHILWAAGSGKPWASHASGSLLEICSVHPDFFLCSEGTAEPAESYETPKFGRPSTRPSAAPKSAP